MSKRAHLHMPANASTVVEGLNDILALSRLSGVTVVSHNGFQSTAALLQAARTGGPLGETVFLFDEWQRIDEPDLAEALRQAIDTASQPHAPACTAGISVLAILDRFEDHLALPPDHPRALADAQTLGALATAAGTNIHCLLLVEESAAALLQRHAARIPGIGAASLHLPTHGNAYAASRFNRSREDDAHGHARRFGTLLERLTERTDAMPPFAAASTERDIEERAAMRALQPPQFAELRDRASAAAALYAPNDDGPGLAQAGCAPEEPQESQSIAPASDLMPQELGAGEPTPVRALPPAHLTSDSSPQAASLPIVDAAELSATSLAMPDPVEAQTMPARRHWHAALAGIALLVLGLMLASRFPAKPKAQATQARGAPAANLASEAPKEAYAEPEPAASAAATPTAPQASPALPEPPLSHAEASAAAQQAPVSTADALPNAASNALPPQVHAKDKERPIAPSAAARRPTLFIVGGGNGNDRRMQALVRSLARHGIANVRIRPGNGQPGNSELRYFHAEARNDALSVRRALADTGFRPPQVRLAQRHDGQPQPRQIELWLGGERGARPATPKAPGTSVGAKKTRKLSAATAAPHTRKGGRS